MRKKWINILLLILIPGFLSAQTNGYRFYSLLDNVKNDGFYNITVTPDLNAHIKTDYSDIRIINDSGKWVPHILRNPSEEVVNDAISFSLKFKKQDIPGISTTLIIENSFEKISNIGLNINNTQAERFCTLSGSNDNKEWFVINDSILINPLPSEKETQNTFIINFPPSTYHFFKIVINNKNKDPFNIKAVTWQSEAGIMIYNKFRKIENPVTNILQKDSGNISYIKITQQQPFHFDYVSLKLSGAKYFSRSVYLYLPSDDVSSFSNPGQLLQSFTISNNSTLQFHVPLTKATVLYFFIKNEDNLPLKVNEVKTACSNHYLTAYLEKGNNYKLILDNESAGFPKYDLSKLDNKITDSATLLKSGSTTPFAENKTVEVKAKNNKWMLWVAIVAALLILLFFTYKMLKEVDKRKNT